MLYLHEITYDSFVVLEANWPVDQARQIVRDMTDITHVIVHRAEGQKEYYYLYNREEALSRLDCAPDSDQFGSLSISTSPVDRRVGRLFGCQAAPDRVVVLDGNDLVGFYDISLLPSGLFGRLAKRGEEKEAAESAEPVTRSLITDFPEKVPQGQKASLLVSLSSQDRTCHGYRSRSPDLPASRFDSGRDGVPSAASRPSARGPQA